LKKNSVQLKPEMNAIIGARADESPGLAQIPFSAARSFFSEREAAAGALDWMLPHKQKPPAVSCRGPLNLILRSEDQKLR
jgi:hypothetical protein